MNKKFLTLLALFLGVSVATAIILEIVCAAFIIAGTVVIIIEVKGCHKIPASGPANTNAPAPPQVPPASTPSTTGFEGTPAPLATLTITVNDDDAVYSSIAGLFTNEDHSGNLFHTYSEMTPVKVGSDLNHPLVPFTVRCWWSGNETNGEILAVALSNNIPIFTGYVARASQVIPMQMTPQSGDQQYYQPITNSSWQWITNDSGEQMQSRAAVLSPAERAARLDAAQKRNAASAAELNDQVEAASKAAQLARRKK